MLPRITGAARAIMCPPRFEAISISFTARGAFARRRDERALYRAARTWQAPGPNQGGEILSKSELGEKQVCPHCGAKFYDLGKRPAVCPKCQTAFDPTSEPTRPKRPRERVKAAPDAAEEEEVDDEVEADEAEDEDVDDVVEDDDDDDIEEVDDDDDEVIVVEDDADPVERPPPRAFNEDDVDEEEDIDEEAGITVIDGDEEFEDVDEDDIVGVEDDPDSDKPD
ncbi:TIGR02300 family protein [bacterium]|nr:TIGR02300 family protein [bacterium]